MIAGSYLAAGGVGTLALPASTEEQRAELALHGPDTKVVDSGEGREVMLAPRPSWWPGADGDATALAFWRGGVAATKWMADVLST
jgi:hypothetical protein